MNEWTTVIIIIMRKTPREAYDKIVDVGTYLIMNPTLHVTLALSTYI